MTFDEWLAQSEHCRYVKGSQHEGLWRAVWDAATAAERSRCRDAAKITGEELSDHYYGAEAVAGSIIARIG